jgi:hypothetical protein
VKSRLLVTVFWRREEWLVRFKNCFGSSSLDRGQSRVPLPPARIRVYRLLKITHLEKKTKNNPENTPTEYHNSQKPLQKNSKNRCLHISKQSTLFLIPYNPPLRQGIYL